jgi:SAM-dependent methyltransferase
MALMEGEARKAREADFHDRAFGEATRQDLWSKYYQVVRASTDYYESYLRSNCSGREVLEYGCGVSSRAFLLAQSGAAAVTGIDISPVAIERDTRRARQDGHENVTFRVMDAERLELPDASFDLVCGTSIIHHLDVERAYSEVSRVLRPEGSAIFVEPLGHNPLINLYRSRTPDLRTPDEHPLRMSDLRAAGKRFGAVHARFFHLQGLLAVPFRRTRAFDRMLRILDGADQALFRVAPPARRYAWQVVLELGEPLHIPADA